MDVGRAEEQDQQRERSQEPQGPLQRWCPCQTGSGGREHGRNRRGKETGGTKGVSDELSLQE